ncbi:Transposon Ty3-G Gag-Pol polyprotein [Araneus ventricosus]|uniref:Transposon Ty3-G Gag-Pol polyprotein n=1 Tax=Araneus ventricosus TaxID=182803 RepID=A0A4Y2WCJ5_ARAVE|nr:Transposon Ty3-G Gag-Pol polyprotein [Araneus ventricosus]
MKAGQVGLVQKMEGGQEEMRSGEERMEKGQEEMRSGQERMEKGQEEMKIMIDGVKGEVQRKIDEVRDKGAVIATGEPVVDIVTRPQEFSGEQHLPSTLDNREILDEEQQTAVRKLLKEFQNLFFNCDADVGRCNMTQHRINTGDHPPIKQYQRRLPLARKEEADHLVNEMVDNGIIEKYSGPWASPIVLVKKKDGSTRFCVHYRKLNEIMIKDSYPLPRIDDTLDALNGSQCFTTLDLKSGYCQVEIRPEDRVKTAFTTGQGF